MTNVYLAVKDKNMPVNRAAVTYGVPESTFRYRVQGLVDPESTKSGPSPLFSSEEECLFADHLKKMASFGYGYIRSEVLTMATDYAIYLGKKTQSDKPLSLKWFYGFIGRWPDLKIVKARSLEIMRAKATSPETVSAYFTELSKILDKYDLHGKPQLIYNVDEKGIQTCHKPPAVVASRDSCTNSITSGKSSTVTILGCGNALGTQIPPYFVFPGKRMLPELLNGSSVGADGDVSDSGWSNSKIFQQYLEHFLQYIQRRDPSQHILLLYDGHRSHISIPVIEWGKRNNIILFVLPAHTSHLLQPMDVGCFGPLQRIYDTEVHKYMRNNPGSVVTRYNICEIACKAYVPALSTENLKSAFR